VIGIHQGNWLRLSFVCDSVVWFFRRMKWFINQQNKKNTLHCIWLILSFFSLHFLKKEILYFISVFFLQKIHLFFHFFGVFIFQIYLFFPIGIFSEHSTCCNLEKKTKWKQKYESTEESPKKIYIKFIQQEICEKSPKKLYIYIRREGGGGKESKMIPKYKKN